MRYQSFPGILLPLLAPTLLLLIAGVVSYRNPRAVLHLSRDGNQVNGVVNTYRWWLIDHETWSTQSISGIDTSSIPGEIILQGDPAISFPEADRGQPLRIQSFLNSPGDASLIAFTHRTLPVELFFVGLGGTLLLGGLASYYYISRMPQSSGPPRTHHSEVSHANEGHESSEFKNPFAEEQIFTKVSVWRLGDSVRIERNLSMPVYLMMLAVAATAGALFGEHYASYYGAIVLGLLGPIIMLWVCEKKQFYRRVEVDWHKRQVRWSLGPFMQSVPFEQVTEVVANSEQDTDRFHSVLELAIKDRVQRIPLIRTLSWKEDRATAISLMEPMARQLDAAIR